MIRSARLRALVPALALLGLFGSGLVHTALLGSSPGAWAALATPPLVATLWFTLGYSLASALGAVALGTALALALMPRGEGSSPARASRVWLALPPVTAGFLVVLVFGATGFLAALLAPFTGGQPLASPVRSSTGAGIVVAAVLKESAFVVLWVRGSLDRLDPRLVPTARMLGAGPWQVFREILAPVVVPSAAVAGLIVFLYALGAWELPFLLGPSDPQALSLFVLDARDHGEPFDRAVAAAALTLLALVSALVAWWALHIQRRLG